MNLEAPTSTVLYSIEEAIKMYRKLSYHNISALIPDITVDQGLILMIIARSNKTQSEIADLIFKDYASMTRILKLMITKNYITKSVDSDDRRKTKLKITEKGEKTLKIIEPVIKNNREQALKNISEKELNQLYETLNKITQNCQIISS